jgi:hypothetical protein
MKSKSAFLVTGILLLGGATLASATIGTAQSSAQAGSSTASSTAVQTDKSGAQASSNSSSSASAKTGNGSASLSSGTSVNASLTQPVDVKKNRPCDQVAAKTTQAVKSEGRVVIPKGSKLIGHVTECKQRGKEEKESALGVVFDRAILKDGQEVPLNLTIRAIAAAQTAAASSYAGDDLAAGGSMAGSAAGSGRAAGGGALGGVRSTAGAATGAVTNTAANVGGTAGGTANSTLNAAGAARGAVGGLNAAGQLTSNSQGVFGLEGLNLAAAASNSTQGSLITSTSKNVRLDTGTQLLLLAQASPSN